MALPQVKKLNHRHQAIVNWLVLNPHRNLKECARAFNYTPQAIYYIVNSGMFQALYRKRCQDLGISAIQDMATKLQALAMMTVDQSLERIANGQATEKFLTDTTKNLLPALGFGPGPDVHEHKHLHVAGLDPEMVQAARERAAERRLGAAPLKLGTGPLGLQLETEPNVA